MDSPVRVQICVREHMARSEPQAALGGPTRRWRAASASIPPREGGRSRAQGCRFARGLQSSGAAPGDAETAALLPPIGLA